MKNFSDFVSDKKAELDQIKVELEEIQIQLASFDMEEMKLNDFHTLEAEVNTRKCYRFEINFLAEMDLLKCSPEHI